MNGIIVLGSDGDNFQGGMALKYYIANSGALAEAFLGNDEEVWVSPINNIGNVGFFGNFTDDFDVGLSAKVVTISSRMRRG